MARSTKFAAAMDRKGIKADVLAHQSGLSLGYIYKLRRGEQTPSLKAAQILADILDEPVTIFLDPVCPEEPTRVREEVAPCCA